MKQIKYFKIKLDKGFSYDSEKETLRVYLPDSRLYYEFEVSSKVLTEFGKAYGFPEVGDFNEWKRDIVSRLEDDNIFYIICPFSSNEVIPTVSELIIYDIFANEMTAKRVCKCFNDFHDQFLTLKPTASLVDKTRKEMTAQNFTFYYDLKKSIFKIFFTNSQDIVFTVLSANSLSAFVMKIQDLLTEPNTRLWLKTLNYDINPKVDNEILDNHARLSTVQELILTLGANHLPAPLVEFISENLFTSKVTDIGTLMSQRDKKLKITNSELLQILKNEQVSVKSALCEILTR